MRCRRQLTRLLRSAPFQASTPSLLGQRWKLLRPRWLQDTGAGVSVSVSVNGAAFLHWGQGAGLCRLCAAWLKTPTYRSWTGLGRGTGSGRKNNDGNNGTVKAVTRHQKLQWWDSDSEDYSASILTLQKHILYPHTHTYSVHIHIYTYIHTFLWEYMLVYVCVCTHTHQQQK